MADDFGDLTLCVSVKNDLPACYWFDTGQHTSQLKHSLKMGCSQLAQNVGKSRSRYLIIVTGNLVEGYILGLGDIFYTYSYYLTVVWNPRWLWCVNSYITEIIEYKIVGVDIIDILLQALKVDGDERVFGIKVTTHCYLLAQQPEMDLYVWNPGIISKFWDVTCST